MKAINASFFVLFFTSLMLIGCDNQVSSNNFAGAIQGMVKDKEQNPLHGDLSNDNLVIKLLGKGDQQAIKIRVGGDGTYQRKKIFPKPHKVWIEGPVIRSDTVLLDFSNQPDQVHDFTVTPLVSPKVISGAAGNNSVSVEYSITSKTSNTIEKKEIYCSTIRYPTAGIGSRENMFSTKKITLSNLSGSISIEGLEPNTKYYLRIGAQANGSPLMNYSNQIEVTTP